MENIIEQLMLSDLCHDTLKLNIAQIKKVSDMETEFEKMLNEKEKEAYRALSEVSFNLIAEQEVKLFKCGFKLGFNLFFEALR